MGAIKIFQPPVQDDRITDAGEEPEGGLCLQRRSAFTCTVAKDHDMPHSAGIGLIGDVRSTVAQWDDEE